MSKDVYESFIIRSSPMTCYFQFFIYYVICKITCSSRNTHATSSSLTRTLSRIERLNVLFIYFVFHCDGRAVEKTISVLCLLNLKQHFIKIFRVLVVRYATGTDNNIYCQVQREREYKTQPALIGSIQSIHPSTHHQENSLEISHSSLYKFLK